MVEEAQKGSISASKQEADANKPDDNLEIYFDVITEHSVTLQSNITDNYLESGNAVHDHIAHNPIIITLSGLSGELVYKPPVNIQDLINNENNFIKSHTSLSNKINEKLGPLPALYPPVDNYTQLAREAYAATADAIDRYKKIMETSTEVAEVTQTRLEEIFEKLVNIWQNNIALRVKTPYKTFDNMYIMNCPLKQGNVKHVTDISITLKQLNFSSTKTTKADEKVLSKYNAVARAKVENHGLVQGVPVDNSTLVKSALNKIGITQAGDGIRRP